MEVCVKPMDIAECFDNEEHLSMPLLGRAKAIQTETGQVFVHVESCTHLLKI